MLRVISLNPDLSFTLVSGWWSRFDCSETTADRSRQPAIVSYYQSHNIALEAYSPLVQGKKASDPTLTRIAEETGKTLAQVLIRWSLQPG